MSNLKIKFENIDYSIGYEMNQELLNKTSIVCCDLNEFFKLPKTAEYEKNNIRSVPAGDITSFVPSGQNVKLTDNAPTINLVSEPPEQQPQIKTKKIRTRSTRSLKKE